MMMRPEIELQDAIGGDESFFLVKEDEISLLDDEVVAAVRPGFFARCYAWILRVVLFCSARALSANKERRDVEEGGGGAGVSSSSSGGALYRFRAFCRSSARFLASRCCFVRRRFTGRMNLVGFVDTETVAEPSKDWDDFVVKSDDFIKWLVRMVFLFVPAKYFLLGDDAKGKKNFMSKDSALFPQLFLVSALSFIGLHLASFIFKKQFMRKCLQTLSLIAGCLTVCFTLLYVGFDPKLWAFLSIGSILIVVVISKLVEFFC